MTPEESCAAREADGWEAVMTMAGCFWVRGQGAEMEWLSPDEQTVKFPPG